VTGFSLEGWSIGDAEQIEWGPWGSGGNARAKILTNGDGYYVALVEAEPGYRGDAHEHAHTEFLYVLSGTVQSQGEVLHTGSAYVAAAGSRHDEFATADGATYLSIFKL
jgi:quercetin dioxygenase-like cupin family protein